MGFIERLQEQLRKEDEAQKQKELESTRRQAQPIGDLESKESQVERSKRYYEESRCSLLVNKLAQIIHGNIHVYKEQPPHKSSGPDPDTYRQVYDFKFNLQRNRRTVSFMGNYPHYVYEENGLGSWVIFLDWASPKGEKGQKCIAIETCPSGETYFYGGWFGSSVIRKDQWQKDQEYIDRALEKAYCHPKRKVYAEVATFQGGNYS